MKPNYNKKVTAVNYVIGHRHGNGYFDFKGTRRINELLVNGYVIRFIPNYQPLNYSFPPKISDFKSINWNPKNMEQARVFSFNFADLVFFESHQKEGKNFTFDSGMDNNDVTTGLIHCINSQEFKQLTTEMQRKMPYVLHERKLKHHIRHDDISDLKFIKFLDSKFIELRELLQPDFINGLMLVG